MTDLQRVAISELLLILKLIPDDDRYTSREIIGDRIREIQSGNSLPWMLTDSSLEELLGQGGSEIGRKSP